MAALRQAVGQPVDLAGNAVGLVGGELFAEKSDSDKRRLSDLVK
jgi:hypothetical protein